MRGGNCSLSFAMDEMRALLGLFGSFVHMI